jgi:FixJ family two-component response regulator
LIAKKSRGLVGSGLARGRFMRLTDTTKHLPRLVATSSTTPTVAVVDDDISVRESLELLIENKGWQTALFESAQEFLAQLPNVVPSCLILDVNLPDLNGLDIQQRISNEKYSTPIIFITGYGDIPTSVRAMKAGAAEFLTKPLDDGVLIEAIRSAVHRSQANLTREGIRRQLQARFGLLSKREREVMKLVVTGLMNKQVGFELGISEITVKAHRGRVMEKMHAATFVDLVNMASRLGIGAAEKPAALASPTC